MVVDVDSLVSMNMWGLISEFLDVLEEDFKEFFEKEVPGNPLKAEYLIPIFIGELLSEGKMSVKVFKTNDSEWREATDNRVHRERDHDGAVFSSSGVDVPREGGSRLEEDTVAKWKDSVQLFSKH